MQLVEILRPYLYAAQATRIDPALVPFHWYKEQVPAGARYHGFPAHYVASIESTPSKADPDVRRSQESAKLLGQIGIRDAMTDLERPVTGLR